MRLQGKVALITGASRGIGQAMAIGFAQEGAQVVVSARTMESSSSPKGGSLEDTVLQITETGGTALAIPCDVSNEIQVRFLVEKTLAEMGQIDVLVNNAGILSSGPITQFNSTEFEAVLAVNLLGPFLTCKHVLPIMIKRRIGNIINVSSRSSIWDEPESLAYGPSKAALNRFTLNLALDMAQYNIAINALSPGLISSEMTKNWNPGKDRLGRIPDPPETVIPAATWLAQQDASTFTGRLVHRDEFGKTWP